MATQIAERPKASPIQVLRQNLEQMQPELKMALPGHVTVEKFSRVAMTAIQNNPDLLNCDRKSLFGAIVRLAQDGLLPDGREAALVKFGQQVQAMPMIAGVLKKVRQSGDVAKVSAQVVYENDEFVWTLGFDEDVTHNPPALDKARGKPIGAYATAVLKDGSRLLEVMSLDEIEQVRNVSRAKGNGPWVTWWGEMARKTVMRRLSKRLPMSTDLDDDPFERDETLTPEPAIEHEQPLSRLEALEQQITGGTDGTLSADNPAATEGRTDADHGDQHPGDDADDDEPKANALIARIEAATILGDVVAIESELKAADLAPDQAKRVADAAQAARARFGK